MKALVVSGFLAGLPCVHAAGVGLPAQGLLLDLDAAKGVGLETDNRVAKWVSEVPGHRFEFLKREEGRKEPGSGRPTLRESVAEIGGLPAVVFLQQELICPDEDAFDSLITGKGHTWAAVLAVRQQRVGLADVNSFFGNLRNGGNYEGLWGSFMDDNRPWYGVRNGLTFGRFDANNPQLIAPAIAPGQFHVIMGRMQAGTGEVRLDFFIDTAKPAATASVPVSATANSSKLVIGQERDAIEHPGQESFDGEIARFLVWKRPLDDAELGEVITILRQRYRLAER
ncbi:MAG: LamG-like jellyroll fold domain-containing protein [Verrucomicrobiota bacterium]